MVHTTSAANASVWTIAFAQTVPVNASVVSFFRERTNGHGRAVVYVRV